jgi:hypothetical protein
VSKAVVGGFDVAFFNVGIENIFEPVFGIRIQSGSVVPDLDCIRIWNPDSDPGRKK